MTETVIAQVKELGQVQPSDIDFLDHKKLPIWELDITVVYAGETEAPHIEMIEP